MDETLATQFTESLERLSAAAQALEGALARFDSQQEALTAKVERIVAAIDERLPENKRTASSDETSLGDLKDRVSELERANADLKAQAARLGRKTLSPLVSDLLAKHAGEEEFQPAALDKALAGLPPDQRIAVKAEMARAGLI
jgi:chromosome segregation ATPase